MTDSPETDRSSPYLSIVEDLFDLPGRDLMDGPIRFRKPLARRKALRQRPHQRVRLHAPPGRRPLFEPDRFHPLGTPRPLTH
jgi:hypothetical protein